MPGILQIIACSRSADKSELGPVNDRLSTSSPPVHPSPSKHTHTQKMSTLGKAFLPCHPPIAPSTHPSSPLIRPGFQERGPETDDPVTSSRASPSLAPSHKLMLTLLTYTVKTLNESRLLLLLLLLLPSFFDSCSCAH